LLKSRKLTSRFKYILFSDADGSLSPDFKKQIKQTLKIKPALLVATVKSHRHGLISAFRTYEYGLSHLIYKNAQNAAQVIAIAPGCASLYRSDVLEKLDFRNGTLSEDFDLTLQIHQKKLGRIIYVPKASVITQDPITLADFWKQVLRWNTGFWQNVFLHRLYLPIKKINLEILILVFDAFFGIGILIYFLHAPLYFFKLFSSSLLVMFAFSSIILIALRQFWAILYAPAFPFLYMINLSAYVAGFLRAIFGQKGSLSWGKVARYQTSPQK
jgi:cellulose synthase/poly-beta-1,6-N-acetylglucosamine synthase-like glycosyltransferase